MSKSNVRRLEQRRARYETQLGPELATIIEGDVGVVTTRMSEREGFIARRYRDVVRQLATY